MKDVGAVPAGTVGRGDRLRVPDDRQDGAGDDVPVFIDVEGNDGLQVDHVLGAAMRPVAEIEVVLDRETDEVADRILKLLG